MRKKDSPRFSLPASRAALKACKDYTASPSKEKTHSCLYGIGTHLTIGHILLLLCIFTTDTKIAGPSIMSPMPVGIRHRPIESIKQRPGITGPGQDQRQPPNRWSQDRARKRSWMRIDRPHRAAPGWTRMPCGEAVLIQLCGPLAEACPSDLRSPPHFLHQFRFLSLTRLHPFLSCRHSFVHLCHFASFPDAVRDMQECCKNICSCFMLCFPHLVGAARKGREASMGTDSIYDSVFKTMTQKMPFLLIPLANYAF